MGGLMEPDREIPCGSEIHYYRGQRLVRLVRDGREIPPPKKYPSLPMGSIVDIKDNRFG